MELQLLTQIALFVGIVLTILTAAFLNQRSQERNFEFLRQQLDASKAELRAEIKTLEKSVDALSQRLTSLENRNESRFDRIERQLDQIFKPVLPPR